MVLLATVFLRPPAAVAGKSVEADARSSREERSKLDGLRVTTEGEIGPPSMRVDLVIVGDGYVEEDFRPGGKWEIDSARLVKNFFEKLPFKTLRSLFNVYLVEVVSRDRGADDSPKSNNKRTALNCTYGASGIDRLLICQDQRAALRAARNALGTDIILILVNDARYGGSGGKIGDVPAPCCSAQATAFLIAIHELGHSFAGLGDEYVDEKIADTYPIPSSGDLLAPNLTLASLVDASSKDSLIETLKWGHFLDEPNAANLYGKGIFEGGYYRTKGIYHPAQSCIMGSASGGGRFCFVCEEEMTRAIYHTAGRGPGGGVFPEEVPHMKGLLRRSRFLYSTGLFGAASSELKRAEKKKDLSAADAQNISKLRKAMDESLRAGLSKISDLLEQGEALAVDEHLALLATSFKGTDLYSRVEAKTKEIAGSESYKKEVKAARDLLKLELALKDPRIAGTQKSQGKKLVEEYLKRYEGTKTAEKARRLVPSADSKDKGRGR